MTPRTIAAICLLFLCGALSRGEQSIPAKPELRSRIVSQIEKAYPHLQSVYTNFHAHPELSLHEEQTSARLADELHQFGFKGTRKVGGYGVVSVLENGPGPVDLVRTDINALPVVEQTSDPYASSTN